jgi:hypothetical protein
MQVTKTFHATATLPQTDRRAAGFTAVRIVSPRCWSSLRWGMLLAALTVATLLIHGYHPFAEDGGLYLAGVEWTLDRSLFPHLTEFVSEHLRFSVFAPAVASMTRSTHLPLTTVLLLLHLASIALTLAGARAVLRRVTRDERAQLAGVAMLAAIWTIPVAGTSLLLMDPYVTGRSLSTPLALWAIAFALDDWRESPRSPAACILTIAAAAAFHPLMAGYALGFILVLRALRSRRRVILLGTLALLTFFAAAVLQWRAAPDSAAVVLAAQSRYYWFLSQWHWYELFGLAGPLLLLGALVRWDRSDLGENGSALALAAIFYGSLATAVALAFAGEHLRAHIVARLQPLRAFQTIYLVLFLLLGAVLEQQFERIGSRSWSATIRRCAPYAICPILLAAAFTMFVSERQIFPASPHLELPGRAAQSSNPWVRAFLWCRDNTPRDALFALDPHYITTRGEDAQTFRAIALRSALPDFSKDGGEAAITPRLAGEWAAGVAAQLDLNRENASELRAHLARLGVDWVILPTSSTAALSCPYSNARLRVCRLQP